MQSMGDCVANGRIDLTGHVILIVEEQPIVALNLQIAAEEAGGEAIIARGANEAIAQLHQFMVSAAIIDPRQRALIAELQSREIRVVLKAGTTGEVLARVARSVSDGEAPRADVAPASATPVNRNTWHFGAPNRDEG
jgi:hypothetical protein